MLYIVCGWSFVHCIWVEFCTLYVGGVLYIVCGWSFVHCMSVEFCTLYVGGVLYIVCGWSFVHCMWVEFLRLHYTNSSPCDSEMSCCFNETRPNCVLFLSNEHLTEYIRDFSVT